MAASSGYEFPENPASEDWHNDYLHKRQGQEYTKLNDSDLCKLGEIWMSMLYTNNKDYLRSDKEIGKATVMLSLHLKHPIHFTELFSPMDQKPKFAPGFQGDSEKDMKKCVQHLTNLPDVLLASEERRDEVDKLMKENASFHNLISGIKLMTVEKQAAFYSFLAATTCGLVNHFLGCIPNVFERYAVDAFKKFYGILDVNFIVPHLNIEVLRPIGFKLSPGSELAVALFKAFLPAYSKASLKSEETVKMLLRYTYLEETCGEGLAIITYVMNAACHKTCSSFLPFPRKLQKMPDSHGTICRLSSAGLKELTTKLQYNKAKQAMKIVIDFMEKYMLAQPPPPDCDWWQWARNINVNSFRNLSGEFRDSWNMSLLIGECIKIYADDNVKELTTELALIGRE